MLTAENICLNYSYKKVLTGVNAVFENGKIYALLGENGAGKSTFAHIICGDLQPTSGRLLLNGEEVSFLNPHQALEKKIACVHQRPLLAENITVRENILLGADKITARQIDDYLKVWLPDVKKNTPVKKINPSQKFFVSLIGILLKKPEILILDEPTALLNQEQSDLLFSNMRNFTKQGMTIILITHYLQEALEKTDKLIILKDGIVESSGDSVNYTEESIRKVLFGTETVFNTQKVTTTSNTSFSTDEDEDTLTGMNSNKIRKLRHNKTAIIPSDRTFRASNPKLTILQLVTAYKTNLKQKELVEYAKKITEKAKVNIKLNEKASDLSGGMLQRLILERELDTNPDTIIFCSPYQGLDAAASQKLTDLINMQKKNGKKVILSGADA